MAGPVPAISAKLLVESNLKMDYAALELANGALALKGKPNGEFPFIPIPISGFDG